MIFPTQLLSHICGEVRHKLLLTDYAQGPVFHFIPVGLLFIYTVRFYLSVLSMLTIQNHLGEMGSHIK